MLKISINRWAFDGAMPVYECIDLAKRCGYDGIELNLEEAGDFSLETSLSEADGILEYCDKKRLEISSLCSLLFWKYPCTSSIEEIKRKGEDIIRKMIDFAHRLKVKNILVVPGLVHADPPLDFGNQPESYAIVYDRAVKTMRFLGEYAQSKDVFICTENVYYNKFLLSPVEFKLFLDDVNHEHVKMYFDTGNSMLCGFSEHWIEHLSPYIRCIHVKDHDSHIHSIYGARSILSGDVAWDKVAKALHDTGYSGYLVGEPSLSPYQFFPEELVISTARALKKLSEMIM